MNKKEKKGQYVLILKKSAHACEYESPRICPENFHIFPQNVQLFAQQSFSRLLLDEDWWRVFDNFPFREVYF